jgi:hypothetical protein
VQTELDEETLQTMDEIRTQRQKQERFGHDHLNHISFETPQNQGFLAYVQPKWAMSEPNDKYKPETEQNTVEDSQRINPVPSPSLPPHNGEESTSDNEPKNSLFQRKQASLIPVQMQTAGNVQRGQNLLTHGVRNTLALENVAQANISGTSGLKPGLSEEEGIGGGTLGEMLGDIGRPVGSALGNVVGSVAGALTGINISSNSNVGPTWSNHGQFRWQVGFNTTAKNGWIVQKIVNTMRAENATGGTAPGWRPTPSYWEAWAVDASGNVTPNIGADNDYWTRPSKGPSTRGHWSMRGTVYFTTTDPATQGFTAGGVADAGILLSTTSAPSGLGVARLHRYAQGNWDSTGTTPTHTGSAAP